MLIDFIIIFVFILAVSLGYKRGICAILLSFTSFALSIVITLTLYNAYSKQFLKTETGQKIHQSVSQGVDEYISDLPDESVNKIPFINTEKSTFSKKDITKRAVNTIITLFLLLGSYVLSKLIIFTLHHFIKLSRGLSIIRKVDSLLGSIGGFFWGTIWIALIYISSGYLSLIDSFTFINEQFNTSILIMFISDFII